MRPRDFLLEECSNIRRSLDESLRHDYGPAQSRLFYVECRQRLTELASQLQACPPSDLKMLTELGGGLSELSKLISYIERSRLGEFSWAFSESLVSLAEPICTESAVFGGTTPAFHILSDGGLDAYRIYSDPEQLATFVEYRIFNVVFPRSLKHHVLLHPVLGHEIGHAAWSIPEVQSKLQRVLNALIRVGPLESVDEANAWLNGWSPHAMRVDDESLDLWSLEFLCDLFGLLIFGPSFVPALTTLLSAVDPTDTQPGFEHPPNVCRFRMIEQAIDYLGWKKHTIKSANAFTRPAITAFWKDVEKNISRPQSHYQVFTDTQVRQAVDRLQRVLGRKPNALFSMTDPTDMNVIVAQLVEGLPPSTSEIDQKGHPLLRDLDFRSILFGGWIAINHKKTKRSFYDINRLCDRSILHSRAIRSTMNKAAK